MRPSVSVVMPAWNAEKTIANAINSIRNQTINDWELIVVNDGSTDKTRDVIQKFMEQDDRIKIWNIAHGGLVRARNIGNDWAEADIIAVQDADDLSMPDRLEKCLHYFPRYDVVYHGGYINMWDAQFQCIGRKYIEAPAFNNETLLLGQYIAGWPVYKKKVWEKKPFRMETQFMYDWMMYLDWAFSGYKFKALNEGLYEYVRHENSASITFERDGRRAQSKEAIRKIMKHEYGKDIGSNANV